MQREDELVSLIVSIKRYNDDVDTDLLEKAWEFACTAHSGQKRLTGEKYIEHSYRVALILTDWKLDTTSIVAALLHDTISAGAAKKGDVRKEFGDEVASLVDGVTKITELRLIGKKEEEHVENLRKMILVMAKDLRVVIIKLADRLHNMRTLSSLSKKQQVENSHETLEIYAPLAERLGIGEVKGELEDLAFQYAYPREYKKVMELSRPCYRKVDQRIQRMKRGILSELAKEGVNAQVSTRQKHSYSLWKKLSRKSIDWEIDKINDIVAFRLILNTEKECYTALGVINSLFDTVPGVEISDFISRPKPNGYRSIHTKIVDSGKQIVEIQIRTQEMHDEAEYGVAAHWAYSEAKSKGVGDEALGSQGVKADEDKLSWVSKLIVWQEEVRGTDEYNQAVKFDSLSHRIFVFSPEGDVHDLPEGSTPIDFAFDVHTDLGNYIKSARVNSRMVSLDHKLKSGDVVEIVKTKEPRKPSRDWLDCVATNEAKRKILSRLESSN